MGNLRRNPSAYVKVNSLDSRPGNSQNRSLTPVRHCHNLS